MNPPNPQQAHEQNMGKKEINVDKIIWKSIQTQQ
jgi:hypothetical protein